jgi:hypothetical protein
MGEHWANPADLPEGPIHTVYSGRLISVEYMLSQADFTAGKNWLDLTFRYWGQPLSIVHADIEFLPRGHRSAPPWSFSYEVPHYDMHFYLVTHAEDLAITCQP